jgi:hypothetical protein
LSEANQFDKDQPADRIAMLAVYMPLVREATFAYKDLWNIHRIRKQPNRPSAVSGQPEILYNYPPGEVQSYGVPVDPEFAKEIESSLGDWGKCCTRVS